MEFRVHVETQGRSIVCSYTNMHRMQIARAVRAENKINLKKSGLHQAPPKPAL